jgi:signal transduction histidine kinase
LHKEGDYIFIGTYGGGFYVMKNGLIKAMPLDVNQYLKYSHCFVKDKNSFYWISTNNGLFKVKLADIIEAYEKDLPQIYYHYLGKEDGMQTTEMNGGCTPCALRLKNDNFSFPTMDGMLWFNPEKTVLSLPTGSIYIDEIWVDDRRENFTNGETFQFSRQAKKIDLSFAVNAWCGKENLYIDYKLNGGKWLRVDMITNSPRISFSNLSYGKYILTIRKMNGFGKNNYSYSSIAFNIARPFYHQWLFRILAVLTLWAIGYLIFRLRSRQYVIKEKKLSALVEQKTMDLNLKNIQLEKNDQIKTRLISVINHDIITPLKFMHYAGKALVENKGMINPEQQLETISDITQTAKDIEMLSSQILNWIIYQNPNERMQKEEFDLHQLVEMVFGVLQFPARLKHTTLQNKVPANFVVYQYMEPLRVLVYNLLLNAINFTKDGRVSVECVQSEDSLILSVTDSGLGMTHEQIDNLLSNEKIIASANVDNKKGTGLGYMIIKDLLNMMGGSLNIKSKKVSGTTVLISIPIK